ncbi:MAG: hypothetical protein ACHQPH_10615 [Reyranellales bacterium]|jgi:putative iron-dependent peroxidase
MRSPGSSVISSIRRGELLENMFVGKPGHSRRNTPGNYDRLLDFSRAVTGTLFFVPPATFLEDVAATPTASAIADPASAEVAGEAAPEPQPAAPGGSLGIGSLRKTAEPK